MKIEHIALYVDNLEAARDFFITYFNAESNDRYHNEKTGLYSYFLSFKDGARLEIMKKPDIADIGSKTSRMGYAHIAFSVGSAEKVNQLTDELRANGYTVSSEPRTTGDGYYESCIFDLEGNQIEITV
ncbi:MAG: VOC family protein [Ruminococcus sp.]|nr:VOC family protein [Ruminococcus sp.]